MSILEKIGDGLEKWLNLGKAPEQGK